MVARNSSYISLYITAYLTDKCSYGHHAVKLLFPVRMNENIVVHVKTYRKADSLTNHWKSSGTIFGAKCNYNL